MALNELNWPQKAPHFIPGMTTIDPKNNSRGEPN